MVFGLRRFTIGACAKDVGGGNAKFKIIDKLKN
jgi:hypothetical protein